MFLGKKRFFDIQLPIFHAKTQVFMLKSTFLPGEMTPFHGQISLFCGFLPMVWHRGTLTPGTAGSPTPRLETWEWV